MEEKSNRLRVAGVIRDLQETFMRLLGNARSEMPLPACVPSFASGQGEGGRYKERETQEGGASPAPTKGEPQLLDMRKSGEVRDKVSLYC
jgi:hypothetical protein